MLNEANELRPNSTVSEFECSVQWSNLATGIVLDSARFQRIGQRLLAPKVSNFHPLEHTEPIYDETHKKHKTSI